MELIPNLAELEAAIDRYRAVHHREPSTIVIGGQEYNLRAALQDQTLEPVHVPRSWRARRETARHLRRLSLAVSLGAETVSGALQDLARSIDRPPPAHHIQGHTVQIQILDDLKRGWGPTRPAPPNTTNEPERA